MIEITSRYRGKTLIFPTSLAMQSTTSIEDAMRASGFARRGFGFVPLRSRQRSKVWWYARRPLWGWLTQEGWAWLACGLLYALVMLALGLEFR